MGIKEVILLIGCDTLSTLVDSLVGYPLQVQTNMLQEIKPPPPPHLIKASPTLDLPIGTRKTYRSTCQVANNLVQKILRKSQS